jgi:hypothetical protein
MDADRRSLLKGLAAGLAGSVVVREGAWAHGSARVAQVDASQRAWGVQLYTVRNQIGTDAAATLKRIAAIGFTELEVLQPTLPVMAPLATALGLTIVSAHLDGATAKGDGFEAFLAQAKSHGLRDVVVPFVPADAIVVGSGISGGWAAKELTEKGLKVLLLERGATSSTSRTT